MAEDKSIFDYSFKDDELKPRRLEVLHIWFKIYLVTICVFSVVSLIAGFDTFLKALDRPEDHHTTFLIQTGLCELLMTLMNLVGAVFIFLEHKRGVLIFIIITILKLAIYTFFAVSLAIDTYIVVAFTFWPILLHIPALLYLFKQRTEWEDALKKSEMHGYIS